MIRLAKVTFEWLQCLLKTFARLSTETSLRLTSAANCEQSMGQDQKGNPGKIPVTSGQ